MPLPEWARLEVPLFPDQEDKDELSKIVMDAWVHFAAAAISACVVRNSGEAAGYADELTGEFVERFIKGE